MTKAEIFKQAHKMAKSFEGNYRACFSLALKEIFLSLKGKKEMKVTMNTGSEWHSTFSSKGYAFVIENGKEDFISNSFKAISQDWDLSKHCKRVNSEFDLPEGTIIKIFFSGFNGSTKNDMKRVVDEKYFIVDPSAPEILFESSFSKYSDYYIKGNLKEVSKP